MSSEGAAPTRVVIHTLGETTLPALGLRANPAGVVGTLNPGRGHVGKGTPEGELDTEEGQGHLFAEGSHLKPCPPWALARSLPISYLRPHLGFTAKGPAKTYTCLQDGNTFPDG